MLLQPWYSENEGIVAQFRHKGSHLLDVLSDRQRESHDMSDGSGRDLAAVYDLESPRCAKRYQLQLVFTGKGLVDKR
jgi:hypothetical protein